MENPDIIGQIIDAAQKGGNTLILAVAYVLWRNFERLRDLEARISNLETITQLRRASRETLAP